MQEVLMPFDGNRVEVVKDEQGNAWVSVRSVCRAIGVDSARQISKVTQDVRYMWRHMSSHDTIGRQQEIFCIPLTQIQGWLFSINPNKVPEDIKPKLIAYQQECFTVLHNHFMQKGHDQLGITQQLLDFKNELKNDILGIKEDISTFKSMQEAIFGDDKENINQLIQAVAEMYQVDGRTVWGWIQTECDVASYKRQNNRVKNYLKNLLGKGLKIVKDEEDNGV